MNINFLLIFIITFTKFCYSLEIGDECIIERTRTVGKCKLLSNCEKARNDILQHSRLPTECGYRGMDQIVCCENNYKINQNMSGISRQKCENEYRGQRQLCPRSQIASGYAQRIDSEEFPHYALLGYINKNNQTSWYCSGALISPRFVLTAAQCITNNLEIIKLGKNNFFNIKRKIIYPDYDKREKLYNLGILELTSSVIFTNDIRPICLPYEKNINFDQVLSTNHQYNFDNLYKIPLNVINSIKCGEELSKEFESTKIILKKLEICADAVISGLDICYGNLGAPLQIYHPNDTCSYMLVGITTYGKRCGTVMNTPGVYLRVSYYLDWIESIVWPNEYSV